jgi:hypothetical protein
LAPFGSHRAQHSVERIARVAHAAGQSGVFLPMPTGQSSAPPARPTPTPTPIPVPTPTETLAAFGQTAPAMHSLRTTWLYLGFGAVFLGLLIGATYWFSQRGRSVTTEVPPAVTPSGPTRETRDEQTVAQAIVTPVAPVSAQTPTAAAQGHGSPPIPMAARAPAQPTPTPSQKALASSSSTSHSALTPPPPPTGTGNRRAAPTNNWGGRL